MSSGISEEEIAKRIAVEKLGVGVKPVEEKREYRIKEGDKRGHRLEKFWWKPGESGNPSGKPKEAVSLTGMLNKKLREHPEDAEAIVNALIMLGKNPNLTQLAAIDKIFDRVDGKVAETHKIEGELPMRIVFMPAAQVLGVEKQITEGEAREL